MSDQDADRLLDAALERLTVGEGSVAERILRQVLAGHPDHAEALGLLGVVQQQLGQPDEARRSLERSLALDPESDDTAYNLAEVLSRLGDVTAAVARLQDCVTLNPAHVLGWRRLAELRLAQGDEAGALDAAGRAAAAASPDDAELLVQVGRLQMKRADWAGAMRSLTRAAGIDPGLLPAHVLLYRTAAVLNRPDVAMEAVGRALAVAPDDPKVGRDRIDLLSQFGRRAEAFEAARAHVGRYRDDPEGHRRLAAAFMAQREYGGAARAAARVIELRPDDATAYALLGEVLVKMGRPAEAVVQFRTSLDLEPELLSARMYHSVALEFLHRRREAIEEVEFILARRPDDVEAGGWLAQLYLRVGRHAEAEVQFDRVLAAAPGDPVALTGVAQLAAAKARPGAWELFERAMAAAVGDDPLVVGTALLSANAHPTLPAWRTFDLHLDWARRVRRRLPHPPFDAWPNDPDPDRRLRVGYVSADLHAHSVAYFLEPLVAAHDRRRLALIAFDNTKSPDNITDHLRQHFDEWHRVVGVGDPRLAELVRERQVDVLVDLNGHTAESRLPVFALRPAPVQVTYLGYPNTTGLTEVDYRLTDAVADPPGVADELATERLVRLPGGFLCYHPPPPYPDVGPSPAGADGPVTFAAFNAAHKINPAVVALWCRVLATVPGSRLLLKANGFADADTRRSVAAAFAAHGMGDDRVRFLPQATRHADHLAVYNGCDLALDTFPYNGTTTTCEALWMGVPVVTFAGDRHAARVGLSLLAQVGLPELAGDTPDDYVRIAAGLATDRPRLAALRASLRDRMRASRLMDAQAHAATVEDAYRTMWQTWCRSARP